MNWRRMKIDKRKIIAALRARLRANLATLTAAQDRAQSGATHEETRQEGPKDTRAIEAGYLARGLAERVETLRDEIAAVGSMEATVFDTSDTIAIGALVGLEDCGGNETAYFLAPCGGGERITVDGSEILILTTTSPLGNALIEKRVDDDIELELSARRIDAQVLWIE